jgi:hypothetical protein
MAKGGKTGGRTAGTPNRVTRELAAVAREHSEPAIRELARLSLHAKSEQARVAAIKELLDRGHGKATQLTEIAHLNRSPRDMTDEELATLVAEARPAHGEPSA